MKTEVSSLPSGSLDDKMKENLYDAFSNGDWETVEMFFSGEYKREAFTERLTESGETAVLVAIKAKRGVSFIQNLIELFPPELLDLTDYNGNTALHTAVDSGDADTAQLIVNKNPKLLNFHNKNGKRPLQLAEFRDKLMEYHLKEAKQRSSSWSKEVTNAVSTGDWTRIENLVDRHGTQVFTARLIAETGMTVLHLAVSEKAIKKSFIKKMVDWMPKELLALTDYNGYTALHHAVMAGHEEAVKLLTEKMPELLNFFDKDCCLLIEIASKEARFNMTKHLVRVGIEELRKGTAGVRAMQHFVSARYYGLALKLFDKRPSLALEPISDSELIPGLEPINAFELIAEDPAAFPSGTFYTSIWKSILYSYHLKIPGTLWKVLEIVVPFLKTIREQHLKHCEAIELVKKICSHIKHFENDKAYGQTENAKASLLLWKPFLSAARNGIKEIVTQILNSFPYALDFKDSNQHSIIHLAVMYRNAGIFNIAHKMSTKANKKFLSLLDDKQNNILHLAAQKAPKDRLDLRPQPILQMQREVKWFNEIQKLVGPLGSKEMNKEKKTPRAVFDDEHAELVKTETKWVTSMATASSVAASLIATVTFTSAITVPGGNREKDGLPHFTNQPSFILFAASDGVALFASITSVLTFLSIFTSRYGPDDFEFELPNRLIIGLIFLTLSVIHLIIAFGSTLFLVFSMQNSLILIPIIASACVPVIFYILLQVPSLLNMMRSTYRRELFHLI